MTTDLDPFHLHPPVGRCSHRGCPFRWRDGQDRVCADHLGTVSVLDDRAAPVASPLPVAAAVRS